MNVAAQAIGYTASVVTTLSSVPQVYQVYRTKTARDVSTAFMCSIITGLGLWFVYGVMINNYPLIGANAVSMTLYSSMLSMKFYFARKYPELHSQPAITATSIPQSSVAKIPEAEKIEIEIKNTSP